MEFWAAFLLTICVFTILGYRLDFIINLERIKEVIWQVLYLKEVQNGFVVTVD